MTDLELVAMIVKAVGPVLPVNMPFGKSTFVSAGMTLRDWFAGKVMEALIQNGRPSTAESVARTAYAQADAMLAARERDSS